MNYFEALQAHYEKTWGPMASTGRLTRGRRDGWGTDFYVGRWQVADLSIWATFGMSEALACGSDGASDGAPGEQVELFMLARANAADEFAHIETLTMVAHFHRAFASDGARLSEGHTVNFGRPWLPASRCSYGLVSRPYTYGSQIESASQCRVLWLLPITAEERAYKIEAGLEALEQKFETTSFDYTDPLRASVV
jgi:hypothetical protein